MKQDEAIEALRVTLAEMLHFVPCEFGNTRDSVRTILAATATIEAPTSEAVAERDNRHDIGAMMANVMFNLAQKSGRAITEREAEAMDKLRKQWDEASFAAPVLAAVGVEKPQQGWISVADRLPAKGEHVIAFRPTATLTQDDEIRILRYKACQTESWQGVTHGFEGICHPTHWMPLPPAPSEQSAPAGSACQGGSTKPSCETCDDRGVVGGHVGQTAESFDYVTEDCPDCQPAQPAAAPAPTDAGIPISDEPSYPHPKCDSACYYHCTEAGTIFPPKCVQPSLAEVIAFLNGEGQLDGMSFGDSDTAKPRGRYWWRKHLMTAWQARGQQQAGVADAVDAARFRYIEDNASTHGGGKGFTITCFVPVDHEDMGCGIDAAIARSSVPGEA